MAIENYQQNFSLCVRNNRFCIGLYGFSGFVVISKPCIKNSPLYRFYESYFRRCTHNDAINLTRTHPTFFFFIQPLNEKAHSANINIWMSEEEIKLRECNPRIEYYIFIWSRCVKKCFTVVICK